MANRYDKTKEQALAFESAVADIQLLGTPKEIEATLKYLRDHASSEAAEINHLLRLLCDDLRKELGLPQLIESVVTFRFMRHRD
jgi:hypothetical protein